MPYIELTDEIRQQIEERGYRGVGCNRFYAPGFGVLHTEILQASGQTLVTMLKGDLFADSFHVRSAK